MALNGGLRCETNSFHPNPPYGLRIVDLYAPYLLSSKANNISIDDALSVTDEFLDLGTEIKSVDGATGVQFIQSATTEAGETITKRAGFDVNPSSSHVQQNGPHLNLQTQVDGNVVKSGDFADPHIPIDPKTIREGDY